MVHEFRLLILNLHSIFHFLDSRGSRNVVIRESTIFSGSDDENYSGLPTPIRYPAGHVFFADNLPTKVMSFPAEAVKSKFGSFYH